MILTYLAWTILGALAVACISIVVYCYVNKYNLGDIIRKNDADGDADGAKKWLIKQITDGKIPKVKVGIKDGCGDEIAEAEIECHGGHGLRVGDSGYF